MTPLARFHLPHPPQGPRLSERLAATCGSTSPVTPVCRPERLRGQFRRRERLLRHPLPGHAEATRHLNVDAWTEAQWDTLFGCDVPLNNERRDSCSSATATAK